MSSDEIQLWSDSYLDTLESTARHPLFDRMRTEKGSWVNVADLPGDVVAHSLSLPRKPELVSEFDRLPVECRKIGRVLFARYDASRS